MPPMKNDGAPTSTKGSAQATGPAASRSWTNGVGGARKSQRGQDAEHGRAGLESGIQTNGAWRPVGPASENRAAKGQSREEGGERDRHGVDFHADNPPELFHPQRFEHERRRARGQQQRRERHRRFAAWP